MPKRNFTKKPAPPTFTDEEKKLLGGYAYAVWSECAYDLLTAVAEERDRNINSVTIPRDEAIEIALDADRLTSILERNRKRNPLITADLLKRIDQAGYDQLIEIVKPAFPYASYGM